MDKIPEDVWPLVAKFMDDKTKRLMRLASTKWFDIIKYDDFKLYFTQSKNMGAIADRLSKYSWPIKVRFNKSKLDDPVDLLSNLSKLPNIVELSSDHLLDIPYCSLTDWMWLSTLTNLQVIALPTAYHHIPNKLWQIFTNLREFSRINFSGGESGQVEGSLKDLQALEFFVPSNTWPYALLPNPNKLTKLRMGTVGNYEDGEQFLPHLTNLKDLYFYDSTEDQDMNLFYLTALEKVTYYGRLLSFGLSNTNLTSLRMDCELTSQSIEQFTNLKNLMYLTLHVGREQSEPVDLSFFSDLQKLQSFVIIKSAHFRGQEYPEVPVSSFGNLSPNLITFEAEHIKVDLVHLTHLTNLEALSLKESLTNVEIISYFSKLTRLLLSQSSDEQSWTSIENLTNLTDLNLGVGRELNYQVIEENLPNLSNLIRLQKLRWGLNGLPNKMDQLSLLTALTQLTIVPNYCKYKGSIENCQFLQELANLIKLTVAVDVNDLSSLWLNLSKLTKLEYLAVNYIDNDDALLLLTSLNTLTELMIVKSSDDFSGRYFTELTSLQSISVNDRRNKIVPENELKLKMPYLLRYDWCFDARWEL